MQFETLLVPLLLPLRGSQLLHRRRYILLKVAEELLVAGSPGNPTKVVGKKLLSLLGKLLGDKVLGLSFGLVSV